MRIRRVCRSAIVVWLAIAAARATAAATPTTPATPPRFAVTVSGNVHPGAITGRLLLIVAKTAKPEPRLRVSPLGPAMFGIDLHQLAPGKTAIIDNNAVGYPVQLAQLKPGDYYVQAVINVYEQVHRADGHTIWVHMNDGTIEFFNTAAGNLYSDVQRVHIGNGGTVHLSITHVIPPATPPADTKWLKHVRIQSQLLTHFWGRPVYVHATVLLPKGYDEHPNARYPSVYVLGHGGDPFEFTTDSTEARHVGEINPVSGLKSGYDMYKAWTSDGFPRVIAITLEQQTPYFPDSYSVNSANNGPYGDAIVQEVMPYLDAHFRTIGKPYARIIEGASTSGWQTLALQLKHPDFFGGAWVLQPDPIDFRHYQLVNIYKDDNAFTVPAGDFVSTERPFRRTVEGQVVWTNRQLSRFEAVLGTHGRSGYQLEAWEAVYGPVGDDGYPKPLWNKLTGKIDHSVAMYMRDHGYDLRYYAQQHWATLGPKLAGKLHFFAGDMDNFYLDLAVYDFQHFLESTTNPKSDATFTFGRPEKGHGWHAFTWAEMVRDMATYVKAHAPSGANTSAWSY
ncbi:MAG TPA: alpha/beta hydrolase-fold protein [Gemmatimonadaceae bacterium]|nr:alpha/beta hydrolase-fold protein [Gemmatimonadaceae bacterium]